MYQKKHFTRFFKKLKINQNKKNSGESPYEIVSFLTVRPSSSVVVLKIFSSLFSSQYPSALHTGRTSGPSALRFSLQRARPSASLRSELNPFCSERDTQSPLDSPIPLEW